MQIPLSGPDITQKEIQYVIDVLKSPHLSLGPKLREFERKFAAYIGSRYAVAVNSGTSGLHLCIKALGISKGDAVITTPFSFVASANCILYENATPLFVDIDPNTLNINPDLIEESLSTIHRISNLKVKAILPVHVFGHPCDMNRIMAIAERYNLYVIEDACEAIGAEYMYSNDNTKSDANFQQYDASINKAINITGGRWKKAGTFGEMGVFAFYQNKQMTTGEGGMIVTNNQQQAELCRSMRNQGRNNEGKWLDHVRLGYNYRLSDINCALGIGQLERIHDILQKRSEVAHYYNERLKNVEELKIPYVAPGVKMSWFVYVIRLTKKLTKTDRNQIMEKLQANGIACNNYFPPIHLQSLYTQKYSSLAGSFPITEYISEQTIALPFYSNLDHNSVQFVCDTLIDIITTMIKRRNHNFHLIQKRYVNNQITQSIQS